MTQRFLLAATFVSLSQLLILPHTHAALPAVTEQKPLPTLAPIIRQVSPAVVNINTRGRVRVAPDPFFDDPFFRRFFGMPDQPRERETQSLGSGVIVDAEKGYILTNHHVVENADEITVTLADNRSFTAKVIGSDELTDVALLQIKAEDLVAIPLGDSDRLEVGDFVIAIGNPFGLDHTVTSGIVSGLGRAGLKEENYEDFIQTDASINPGNSGGALVNLRGELIGINTAILSRSGGNIGIGFAIPINMARAVMDQLVQYGQVERGMLGVTVQDLTPELAKEFKVPQTGGALVTSVAEGSAAEKAGVQQGDVIVTVNGKPVTSSRDLRNRIGLLRVGEKVRIEFYRDGRKQTVTATIASIQEQEIAAAQLSDKLSGAQLADITEGMPMYGKVKGVVVTDVEPRSPAARAGLRPGDVITSVNRQAVENLAQMREVLRQGDGSLLLVVRRGNSVFYALIQ
ncbi:MAG TPA: DegQ family serine endoprotease [Gammaproteobacteria bacterium]|nr:DegQ family serine endoprotease [Gammaproteobacteria bacterium]